MNNVYDLIGIGVGPFNLSLAALIKPLSKLNVKFLDNKKSFSWHEELMFGDAQMQTSYLKDLVTPIDPTNPYSFLNYLVQKGQFYHFLNTGRKSITRMEFDQYCKWVATELQDSIDFDSKVLDVEFHEDKFKIIKKDGEYFTKNLCIASGPVKNIPKCAEEMLSEDLFHAKSPYLQNRNFTNKKILVVGGGQTGIEIFRNALNGFWGKPEAVSLISGRDNLRPLDEGPFTNEVFTPEFVSNFYNLPQGKKDDFTQRYLLASDGNTPEYLQELYNELYIERFYVKNKPDFKILPMRWLQKIEKTNEAYSVSVTNLLNNEIETNDFDIIILATGFRSEIPQFLKGIKEHVEFDQMGRPVIDRDYKLKTSFKDNHIYTMNFSRHGHGVADPQTSLMSWRSAVIANKVLQENYYNTEHSKTSFLNFY